MSLGKTSLPLAILALAGSLGFGSGPAQAQSIRIGTLTCNVAGGLGLVVASSKEIACAFAGPNSPPEAYVGVVRRFGVDLGGTTGGQLVWAVVAPSDAIPAPGALTGSYVGAGAQATVGAGLGANALLGGGPRSFALQPLSVEGQAGLNVAAGVADLELRPARLVRR